VSHDQNKKTLRSFQCRDYLWEIFGQMSGELECSVDYLINEAMRQYARSRNYGVRSPSQPGMPRPPMPGPAPSAVPGPPPSAVPGPAPSRGGYPGAPPPGIPSLSQAPAPRPSIPSAPPPPPRSGGYGGGYGGGYPPQQPQPPSQPAYPAGGGGPSSYPPPPRPGRPSAPPPLPGQGPPPLGGGYGGSPLPSLYVIFNGQKIPVTKEEFVIGRGSKTADLPIKDGNISRRHAAIVFQGGAFYIKDLGSTNGIEHQGRRIDSKRIDEGDIVQVCDYELRFTYR